MAEYYVEDAPDQPVAIHLNMEALDKIGQEVMSGFGKVPRRGAEVGGILLGAALPGERPTVRIDDFVPVPVEYRFGPSWLLSEADELSFAAAITKARDADPRVVGLVRSNTRAEEGLTPEDLAVLEKYFPERPCVVLLIRPFATRPSRAVFFALRAGSFAKGMSHGPEFPFRRRDLSVTSKAEETAVVVLPAAPPEPPVVREAEPAAKSVTIFHPAPAAAPASPREERPAPERVPAPSQSTWTWIPLSFVFLLIGLLLGFQASLAFRNPAPPPDPYDLRLAVTKSGTNLTVRWDHASVAIRTTPRGTLYIQDGLQQRPIELGATELTSGSVIYTPATTQVHFRLEVFPKDNASLTQTVEWKQ